MMKKSIILLILALPLQIFSQDTVIDIYGIKWGKENLKTTTLKNGAPLFEARTYQELEFAASNEIPTFIDLDFDKSNHSKYGYLYNGYAVFNNKGLIPEGCRLPTKSDFNRLIENDRLIENIKLFDEFHRKHAKNGFLNF